MCWADFVRHFFFLSSRVVCCVKFLTMFAAEHVPDVRNITVGIYLFGPLAFFFFYCDYDLRVPCPLVRS